MIKKKTKEEILASMLMHVDEEYDKSEGSLFFDNLSPASIEMEKIHEHIDFALKMSFAETAEGIYLDYRCKEQGIVRRQPTKARGVVTIEGISGTVIAVGTKVASDTFLYQTTEEVTVAESGTVNVNVESIEAGEKYNVGKNVINRFPVTIPGLNKVTNKLELTDGYDGEDDESLRRRYFIKVNEPATSGNKHHYKQWALEVEGVGNAKVFGLWNGNGTVKVVIIDSNMDTAQEDLIKRVKDHIENCRPIGPVITVKSAVAKKIDIKAKIKINKNVNLEIVKTAFTNAIKNHLKNKGYDIDAYVSYAKIGNLLLNVNGVEDFENLTVNGGVKNIKLDEEEIAKIQSIELEEVK